MFGYVKPFIPELKICEFDAYNAVYCGLCDELGKSFGPFARLTLSYDFTFLSILHLSLSGENIQTESCRCFVNPLKKALHVRNADALRFGADIAAISLYYKLLDNISDSGAAGKIGWSLLKLLTLPAYKKAAVAIPEADCIIRESVMRQAEVEAGISRSLDESAEPTATAMSKLFSLLPGDEKTRRVLDRLGYFIGRYVYISDALDDLGEDLKKGGYNPLILMFGLQKSDEGGEKFLSARTLARESLYMTIGEAARAYSLLTFYDFKPVLDNIVLLGLKNSSDLLEKNKTVRRRLNDRPLQGASGLAHRE